MILFKHEEDKKMEVSDYILNYLNKVNTNMSIVIDLLRNNQVDIEQAIRLLSTSRVDLAKTIVGVAENIPCKSQSQNVTTAKNILGRVQEEDLVIQTSYAKKEDLNSSLDSRII